MKRIWTWTWKLALGAVILVIAAMIYFRMANPLKLAGMQMEHHPVWREFAFRRVHAGDPVDALTRRFPPHRQDVSGRFVRYDYYDSPLTENQIPFVGFTILAVDGKVAAATAWSCTWNHSFLKLNAADQAELDLLAKEGYKPLNR